MKEIGSTTSVAWKVEHSLVYCIQDDKGNDICFDVTSDIMYMYDIFLVDKYFISALTPRP